MFYKISITVWGSGSDRFIYLFPQLLKPWHAAWLIRFTSWHTMSAESLIGYYSLHTPLASRSNTWLNLPLCAKLKVTREHQWRGPSLFILGEEERPASFVLELGTSHAPYSMRIAVVCAATSQFVFPHRSRGMLVLLLVIKRCNKPKPLLWHATKWKPWRYQEYFLMGCSGLTYQLGTQIYSL